MRTPGISAIGKQTWIGGLLTLLLLAGACGGGGESTGATSGPNDAPPTETSETTTTTIEAPPETVIVTAEDRVSDLVQPTSYSKQVVVQAQDDQGYTFTAVAAVAIGNGRVDIGSSRPGRARYGWDIAFDLTITNTTVGRQLPLKIAGLLVWLPGVQLALSPDDVRVSAPFAPTILAPDGQTSYTSGLVSTSESLAVDEAKANEIAALINAGQIEAIELTFVTNDQHKVSFVFDPAGNQVKSCISDGSPLSGYFNCWRDG